MKRITENIESLNAIREKCKKKQSDFTKEELRHLNLVNIELQKSFGKKFVKPLDKSCGYCVITAMNSVHNYIVYEESKDSETNKAKHIEQVRDDNKPTEIGEWGEKKVDLHKELSSGKISDLNLEEQSNDPDIVTISSGEIEVEVLEDSFFGESTSEQLTGIEEIARQVTDKELSLPDLRKKYPNIKARSKTDFLKKLNEQ